MFLICVLCQVFGKLIRNYILNFIEDINCNQDGFISGKSILSNVLESFDIMNEYLMEGDNADIIFWILARYFIWYLIVY